MNFLVFFQNFSNLYNIIHFLSRELEVTKETKQRTILETEEQLDEALQLVDAQKKETTLLQPAG